MTSRKRSAENDIGPALKQYIRSDQDLYLSFFQSFQLEGCIITNATFAIHFDEEIHLDYSTFGQYIYSMIDQIDLDDSEFAIEFYFRGYFVELELKTL